MDDYRQPDNGQDLLDRGFRTDFLSDIEITCARSGGRPNKKRPGYGAELWRRYSLRPLPNPNHLSFTAL
jgi:hypothetical protein